MEKYRHFQRSVNLLTPMGLFQFICSIDITVSCFQKTRFGEIVNSGSQSNSKVQSTLMISLDILSLFHYDRTFTWFLLLLCAVCSWLVSDILLFNSWKQKYSMTKSVRWRSFVFPVKSIYGCLPCSHKGNGSFRPLSRSPWVVSTWVVSPPSFRPPLRESFRPPTLSRFAHYLMSRFAHFLNLYFIEAIVINIQFLFPSMKILVIFL